MKRLVPILSEFVDDLKQTEETNGESRARTARGRWPALIAWAAERVLGD
jgi:hypothetical protein